MNFFKPNFWDKNKISFLSIIFFPISLLVKFFILLNYRLTKANNFSIPIICVGNIYLGGTGKTPLCIEIFSILKNLNINPVFIRKKYSSFQDEFKMLKKTGTIYENKKRAEAIREAIKNKADVAILDDGFQDLSINKNLSIICFNEKQWIGNGLIIPAGPLRESLSALQRANCVIINGNKNIDIENTILEHNKEVKIFYTKYLPQNIGEFKNKKITAFAGIGNPENFFNLLKNYNIDLKTTIRFPDHYNYNKNELINLIDGAKRDNTVLLTTEKDYYRINKNFRKEINFLKVVVNIKDKDQFIGEIKKIL
jgi:tetraacyldisaccharide 4'-kinase